MNIVFMGTPEFAVATLDALVKNKYNVVGVVTMPDKPAGRGQQLQMSAVKTYAIEHNIKVLQPTNLKDENFIQELKSLRPDLQVVVAFRMLPEQVWNLPPLGTYNLHGSLLPQYRGAAPLNWAIINGEKESGVTTFKLQHQIDTGNILLQEKIAIDDNMNVGQMHDSLMHIGANLIIKSLQLIETNHYELKKQDDLISGELKHAPKIFKDTCKINWNLKAHDIHNLVRGLSPYPAAFTEFKDDKENTLSLKIFETTHESTNPNLPNGTIVTDNKTFLKVACDKGSINIHQLQLAGKKRMTTEEFLRGYNFKPHTIFI